MFLNEKFWSWISGVCVTLSLEKHCTVCVCFYVFMCWHRSWSFIPHGSAARNILVNVAGRSLSLETLNSYSSHINRRVSAGTSCQWHGSLWLAHLAVSFFQGWLCPGHPLAPDPEASVRTGRGAVRIRGLESSAAALGRRSAWPNVETSRTMIIRKSCLEEKDICAKIVGDTVLYLLISDVRLNFLLNKIDSN